MEYFHIDGMHQNIFLPFTRQFFFFLSPCYMKYYFLQEYGRLLSIYVTLHFWTLGKQEYCQQFRSVLRNIRTCWVRQSKLLYITKLVQNGVPTMPSCLWLNHCTIQLCVCSDGCKGEPGTHNPPPPVQIYSFSCSFRQFFCKVIYLLELELPPQGNPGSATGMIKKCARVLWGLFTLLWQWFNSINLVPLLLPLVMGATPVASGKNGYHSNKWKCSRDNSRGKIVVAIVWINL